MSIASRSFRTRIVIAAAVIVVLVQLVGALVDVYSGYLRLSTEMDTKGHLIVEQTATAVAQPMWDFDDDLVAEMLESLLEINDVARLVFVSATGETKIKLMSETLANTDSIRFYKHPIVISDGDTIESLGFLEVAISKSSLWTALWEVILIKTIVVVASLGLASSTLYLVLGHLSKPLEDLQNAVHAIEREDFDVPVPGRDRQDELGALANAIDGLREREAELLMLRRANSEKFRRESKRIQQALHSTRDAVVLVDESNNIIFTNASAETHFPGFTLGTELIERRNGTRSRADELRTAMLSRKEMNMEISLEQRGTVRHFQARTGPIADTLGNDLGGLFLASDFTEQFEQSREASYLASHDPLTGLLNRRQMDVALAKWIKDSNLEIGVMLIDLDHFKAINDTFGHQDGDDLLVLVAQKLGNLSLPDDLVVRLGGDEFAIIARGENCERHLHKIASSAINDFKKPTSLGERIIQVSTSIGIATSASAGWDVQRLMRHADLALYEAKRTGRGRYKIFKDELFEKHKRHKQLEVNLRWAIETDQIYPAFQVQTAIGDGSVVGFEALARWQCPDLGMISPAEFIPLAEKNDLIEDLTRLMLIASCEAALDWHPIGFNHRIAINISPKLFDGVVCGLVQECLDLTNCPPEWIELEITESVLLSNSDAVKKEIEDLRAMGLTIALDDFGVGYSSLDYLRRFPVDKIKIDRTFVCDVENSEQSRAIVTAISQLGHSIGMKVTGEGAETEEARVALAACGVDVIQGYVDGQPVVKSEAELIYLTGPAQQEAVG